MLMVLHHVIVVHCYMSWNINIKHHIITPQQLWNAMSHFIGQDVSIAASQASNPFQRFDDRSTLRVPTNDVMHLNCPSTRAHAITQP